jgi:protein TonB
LPEIGVEHSPIHSGDFDGNPASLTSGGVFGGGGGLASPTDGVYTPTLVDKAAAPQPDNPAPVYPASLRSAQIEGTVLAMFVVDTLGRAEPATIRLTETTHPQFAEAVRQSLLRSRYLPAMVRGRPVRQLVEQRFAFTLTR